VITATTASPAMAGTTSPTQAALLVSHVHLIAHVQHALLVTHSVPPALVYNAHLAAANAAIPPILPLVLSAAVHIILRQRTALVSAVFGHAHHAKAHKSALNAWAAHLCSS